MADVVGAARGADDDVDDAHQQAHVRRGPQAVEVAMKGDWAFLIVLDPLAKAYGFASLGSSLDSFTTSSATVFRSVPFTSLANSSEFFSRCSGVYFGLFFGFLIYPLWRRVEEVEPLARFWLFLSMEFPDRRRFGR